MRYYAENPDEPIRHDWFAGAARSKSPLSVDEMREYAELLHKFGCSDITDEQMKRLEELQAKTQGK